MPRLQIRIRRGRLDVGLPGSAFAKEKFGPDSTYGRCEYLAGDMNTSIIRTVKGNTIMLQFCESTPRPYTRMNLLRCTP